jgi:L-threonylcarbamoyladenylate synthase
VAYPTDTLYGLGASIANAAAVARVFAIKGRGAGHGVPVLVASVAQLGQVAMEVPTAALDLARRFWPGGLTMVLRGHPSMPEAVTVGNTVAVRHPDHPVPLALIAECGGPITGTSANARGGPQPTTALEVERQLGNLVDMVLDGGPCAGDVPSTILDLTVSPARVVRTGAIPLEELRAVCLVEAVPGPSAPA